MPRTVLKVGGGGWWVVVGFWLWLKPISVFSLSLDQAEHKIYSIKLVILGSFGSKSFLIYIEDFKSSLNLSYKWSLTLLSNTPTTHPARYPPNNGLGEILLAQAVGVPVFQRSGG